jgi:hypothetical protein
MIQGEITPKGTRIALGQTRRWVIERTIAWHNRGFVKLAVCTESRIMVIEALIAFANTIIVLRRLAAKRPSTRTKVSSRTIRPHFPLAQFELRRQNLPRYDSASISVSHACRY